MRRRTSSSLNYAIGSLFGNTFNIYLHGTAIISVITLVLGVLFSGSVDEAFRVLIEFYLSSLLRWPWNEVATAATWIEFVVSHIVTIAVGLVSATHNYWRNPGYGGRGL